MASNYIPISPALFINKIAASSYHPCTNGGVERVKRTMAFMLAMVGDEQKVWDL